MICRYNLSQYLEKSCPCPTSLTGAITQNSTAYISCIIPKVSGFGTGSSYLNQTDSILKTEENINLTSIQRTGCQIYVGVFFSGFCNSGDANPTFALSGSATSYDSYLAYLSALTGLMALTGFACST